MTQDLSSFDKLTVMDRRKFLGGLIGAGVAAGLSLPAWAEPEVFDASTLDFSTTRDWGAMRHLLIYTPYRTHYVDLAEVPDLPQEPGEFTITFGD